LFIIFADDLKSISTYNAILKYADDTTLLVPQHASVTLADEFAHLIDWSVKNKLTVNTAKTKEIIFRTPRLSKQLIPSPLPCIEQVTCVKILGVFFTDNLSPHSHVNSVLTHCSQRLYLLSQLKYQNLSSQALDIIFHGLILSKIIYALPAYAGQLSVTDKNRLNKFFRKANRRGLSSTVYDIDHLIDTSDSKLFKLVQYSDHCLHHLLPVKRNQNHYHFLRPRGHDYKLSQIKSTAFKNAFVNRCLFDYM